MQTLFDLGLRLEDIVKIIQGLTVADYISGPEEDHDGTTGQIWKFIHPVSGCEVYIKLKFQDTNEEDHLTIISFHKREH